MILENQVSRRALPHYRRVRTRYVYMINIFTPPKHVREDSQDGAYQMSIPTSFLSLAHSPWPKNCYDENIILQFVTPAFTTAGVYTNR